MSTTKRQEEEFRRLNGLDDLLQDAIDYIADTMTREDVFGVAALEFWAEHNGFVLVEGGDV